MTSALPDRLSTYIASRYPHASVFALEFLVSGYESEIHTFRLQRPPSAAEGCILRLFPGEGAAAKLGREARALDLLHRAGYPVPALLLQEADHGVLGKPFEIIERLDGQALWPLLAAAELQSANLLLTRFGSLLAQLHALDWRLFAQDTGTPGLILDSTLSDYRSLYTKYNLAGFLQIVDWLAARKDTITVHPAAVHQDFHANNVFLCADGRLVVIDWTQFAVSDYRIDLCWTLLVMGALGNADWGKQILDAYAAHSVHPVEDLDYFNVIVYMKLLGSTVISFTHTPQELGLRPEAMEAARQQFPIYRQLAARLRAITGISVPELEKMLDDL